MDKNINILGFGGEFLDNSLDNYHLGNGYRAYNPELMCFTCPDDASPFGAGGLNPYVYCSGDPINKLDPNGHFNIPIVSKIFNFTSTNRVAGTYMNVLSIAATVALAVGTAGTLAPVEAALLGTSLFYGTVSTGLGTAVKWVNDPTIKKELAFTGIAFGILANGLDVASGVYGAYKWISNPVNLEKPTISTIDSIVATPVDDIPDISSKDAFSIESAMHKDSGFGRLSKFTKSFASYVFHSYASKNTADKLVILGTQYMRVSGVFGITAAVLANVEPPTKAATAGKVAITIGEVNSLIFLAIGLRSVKYAYSNRITAPRSYNLNQDEIETHL